MRRFTSFVALFVSLNFYQCGSAPAAPHDHSIVLHAAGTVQLRVPVDWYLAEVPYRREVRLVIAPTRPEKPGQMPTTGIWLSVHARPANTKAHDSTSLTQIMPERIRSAAGSTAVMDRPTTLTIGGWPAIGSSFTKADSQRSSQTRDPATTDPSQTSRPASSSETDQRGFHVLIGTDWSLIELHATSTVSSHDNYAAALQQILADIELREPVGSDSAAAIPAVQAASEIIGVWKAYRSRFRLQADGRIIIQPDRPSESSRRIDVADEEIDEKYEPIIGQFEARDDLLLVQWDDGSRLNFRWRLSNGQLLLTGSDGRTSQLRKIFE